MRWKHDPPPKKGETRTVTRFLWFPKRIGRETRWLEVASWTERASVFERMEGGVDWVWMTDSWVRP